MKRKRFCISPKPKRKKCCKKWEDLFNILTDDDLINIFSFLVETKNFAQTVVLVCKRFENLFRTSRPFGAVADFRGGRINPHAFDIYQTHFSGTQGTAHKMQNRKTRKLYLLRKSRLIPSDNDIPYYTVRELTFYAYAKHVSKKFSVSEEIKRLSFGNENVISLLRYAHSRSSLYLIFPYFEHSLKEVLYNLKPSSFDFTESLSIFFQVLKGLSFIHNAGFIHRNLKPEHIMIDYPALLESCLDASKPLNFVKIADFGICGAPRSLENRQMSFMVCTIWYRPPEILLGGRYSSKCDIFSAALIFLELLTGKCVLQGDSMIGQIMKILNLVGSPEDVSLQKRFPHFNGQFPQFTPKFDQFFEAIPHFGTVLGKSDSNRDLRVLVQDMMALLPENRPSASVSLCSISESFGLNIPQVRESSSLIHLKSPVFNNLELCPQLPKFSENLDTERVLLIAMDILTKLCIMFEISDKAKFLAIEICSIILNLSLRCLEGSSEKVKYFRTLRITIPFTKLEMREIAIWSVLSLELSIKYMSLSEAPALETMVEALSQCDLGLSSQITYLKVKHCRYDFHKLHQWRLNVITKFNFLREDFMASLKPEISVPMLFFLGLSYCRSGNTAIRDRYKLDVSCSLLLTLFYLSKKPIEYLSKPVFMEFCSLLHGLSCPRYLLLDFDHFVKSIVPKVNAYSLHGLDQVADESLKNCNIWLDLGSNSNFVAFLQDSKDCFRRN
eukprot:snap_masked-scaffold_13-processed-gene-2.20-mRNA-1 protein AED:0.45 eAED:0.45 QI:0/-1/0/1/-1/1/1/0/726